MPKQLKITLTTEELKQVEEAVWQDDRPEVRQRAEVIRLLHLGHRKDEVAEKRKEKDGKLCYRNCKKRYG